jgi:hypothetical protein
MVRIYVSVQPKFHLEVLRFLVDEMLAPNEQNIQRFPNMVKMKTASCYRISQRKDSIVIYLAGSGANEVDYIAAFANRHLEYFRRNEMPSLTKFIAPGVSIGVEPLMQFTKVNDGILQLTPKSFGQSFGSVRATAMTYTLLTFFRPLKANNLLSFIQKLKYFCTLFGIDTHLPYLNTGRTIEDQARLVSNDRQCQALREPLREPLRNRVAPRVEQKKLLVENPVVKSIKAIN